jgi:hypothetical protein
MCYTCTGARFNVFQRGAVFWWRRRLIKTRESNLRLVESPVRRFNAGLFEADHPGDYANPNSYQPCDGIKGNISHSIFRRELDAAGAPWDLLHE